MTEHTILITGFPGFLAGQLVRRLRAMGCGSICALVVPAMGKVAETQAAEIAAEDGLPLLRIVTGDITEPDLGIDQRIAGELAESVTQVFHLAAIYDLTVAQELAEKVNVGGTRHVLDFCERIEHLERLVYFSTCYVAGRREGTILEEELEAGQTFRNHYESTKYDAEVEVRRRRDQIPTVIIRPSVVVGNSRTGATIKYDGPYFMFSMFARWEKRGFRWALRLVPDFGKGQSRLNVAPVDFIIEATARLSREGPALGRTFQLADPDPLTMRQVVVQLYQLFGLSGPWMRVPVWVGRLFSAIPGVSWFLGFPRETFDYYDINQGYDTRNVSEVLGDISCPRVRDYLPVLVDYVRRHPFDPGRPAA